MLNVPTVTPDAISALSAREMRRAVLRRWLFRFSVLIGWIAFIGVWYFFSRVVFNPQQLPEPHVVAQEAWTLITERDFRTNMQASLFRVLAGFLLAALVSTGLGWLIAYNAWWRTLLRTIVQFVVSTPIVALAILTLVVFGVSSLGPVITTAVVATPYIMMNVAQGLTGVDRRLIVMSESFGRTRSQIISGVLLPSSLISVLAGARLVNEEDAAMGVVTSATVVPSPDGASIIGLGYVRTAAVQVGGTLHVVAEEGNGDDQLGITARITAQPLLFGGEKPGPSH